MGLVRYWEKDNHCPVCYQDNGTALFNDCICENCKWRGHKSELLSFKQIRKMKLKKLKS